MYEVYLLDDEKWLLESLYKSINWNKYHSTVIAKSTNSIEAYREIKYRQPDIVFTDVRMPDMDGIELMKKLSKENCRSVFIVITGYAEFEYVQKALEYNAVSYCLKPFEEEQIIEALLKAQKKCENKRILNALQTCDTLEDSKSNNQTYHKVCDFIQTNFMHEMTLQRIADTFHVNASYLSDLFKRESGMTYSAYLTELRLNYACELLSKTQFTVNEVAEQCGFQNYVYFARIFKKYKCMTPTQYRLGNY